MPQILRRPLAGADIAEIWDYIAEDSVGQADAWVHKLEIKVIRIFNTYRPRMHPNDGRGPSVSLEDGLKETIGYFRKRLQS